MIDFNATIADHLAMVNGLAALLPDLQRAAREVTRAVTSGGRVVWFGNGGSAADSQHLAAELVGRFTRERRALPAIALTTDSSILTALANDYSFDGVFARQVEAHCRPGDVAVGISTSGNSPNVLQGLQKARDLGVFTIGLTGGSGGRMARHADLCLVVPARATARIQEGHILLGHMVCDWVEAAVMNGEDAGVHQS